MEKIVLPIHFEDRSGIEFERLSFAYISRVKKWKNLEWLGQSGGEGGRDIWGIDEIGSSFCYQCANHKKLAFAKAQEDIDKLVKNKTIPDNFILIAGGPVSSTMKTKISNYAHSKGIKSVETWTGVEFEEKLRKDTPELIKRFVDGEEFPDTPKQLTQLAENIDNLNDKGIILLISECFDRPAFTTPFYQESNIPDFEKAMTDTIEVLNTGIHRLRDGTLIRKIPSRHKIANKELKKVLSSIADKVVLLRKNLQELIHSGDIRPCDCDQPDCPVYMISPDACDKMDNIRKSIFQEFKKINPEFNLSIP